LKKAVPNAKNKADIATTALGLKVTRVKLIIIEGVVGIQPSPPPSPPNHFLQETTAAGPINLRPNLFLLVLPYISMSVIPIPYASSYSMQSWKLRPLGASKAAQISAGA